MALRRLLRTPRSASSLAKGLEHTAAQQDLTVFGNPALLRELVPEQSASGTLQRPWSASSEYRSSSSAAQRLQAARRPLSDPKPSVATYQVEVITGDVRGAGTSAPALLRLIGNRSHSEEYLIGKEDEEYGFERGSKRSYTFQVGRELGDLRRLLVQQVEVGSSDVGTGWFLHQVVVTSPEGSVWHFPCNSWIGRSDADGLQCGMERNLIPTEVPHLEDRTKFLLPEPLKVIAGAISIPHPEKIAEGGSKAVNRKLEGWGGEDAYFCTPGRPGIFGLGVADGVYMWKTKGIDSGLFSRTLMSTARGAVVSGVDDVVKLLQATHLRIDEDSVKGSSTACLVLIDTLQGRLTSANIGDSGFLVLAEKQEHDEIMPVKYHSPQQEHQFGCPYQLGHHDSADTPEAAMLMTLPVASGDIVILGTDGLWDNLTIADIATTVTQLVQKGTRASLIAQRLAALAFEAAMDKKGITPYSLGASEAFDMVYSGGKPDDITVVVTHLQ